MPDSAFNDYTIDDLRTATLVRAFHPHTVGVIHTAKVLKVGRKWLHVSFPLFGDAVYRLHPRYVTEVLERT